MGIVKFLRARLDEDEAAARAAIDPARPGTHWHWWRADEQDRPAIADEDTGGDYMEDEGLWLCTVEEFPTTSGVGPLPGVIISHAEEVKAGGAFHIARHDPARVLREVEAKRVALGWFENDDSVVMEATICAMAAVYADHPDYDPEWSKG